jgi:hypothetical protein
VKDEGNINMVLKREECVCVWANGLLWTVQLTCFAKIPEILRLVEVMEDSLELGCPYEDVYSVDWPWVKVNVLIENTRLTLGNFRSI